MAVAVGTSLDEAPALRGIAADGCRDRYVREVSGPTCGRLYSDQAGPLFLLSLHEFVPMPA